MAFNSQQKPILIIPFIMFLTIVVNPLIKLSDSAGTTFDLIHRDQLPGRQHLTLAERVKQMLQRDMIRMQMIQTNSHHNKQQQNVGPTFARRQTLEGKKVAMSPITSGYSDLVGEYFVEITVGTPPKKFSVVADTGSDLTWLDCKYKGFKKNPNQTVVFDADHSKSFKTIDCSSTMCRKDLLPLWSLPDQCPHPKDSCHYNFSYGGTYSPSRAQGIFAYETVTFTLTDGTRSPTPNMLIGCTNSRQDLNPILGNGSQGIMGLGNSRFALQNLFGNTFSYCLVDMKSDKTKSSKLFLGPKINGKLQTTKLELVKAKPHYGLKIKNIRIGGELLNIRADTWNFTKGNGAIIDSGTTLTWLIDSAYWAVIDALNKSMSGNFKSTSGPDPGLFELCYAATKFNYSLVPEMKIGFVDGATFVVPGKNYVTDVLDNNHNGVKCMAFGYLGNFGVNVIGNLLQQSNLWEFDIGKGTLSFGSSTCT